VLIGSGFDFCRRSENERDPTRARLSVR
jgi:hypothetical protein